MALQESGSIKKKGWREMKISTLFASFGIESLILIIILLVVTVILNYFGIVPVSKNFPGIFGFLPEKGSTDPVKVDDSTSPVVQEEILHPFQCPILIDDCSSAISIYDPGEDRVAGIAYPFLSPDLSILAIIDGTYTITEDTVDGMPRTTITIQESEGDLKVTYVFQGKKDTSLTENSGPIQRKNVIGTTDGDRLPLFDFSTELFSLSVTIENTQTGEVLPLRPAEDGKGLVL